MIVYACSDLIFSTKARSTGESLNLPMRQVRGVEALDARLHQVDDGYLNEPVWAVLIDLDLGDSGLALIEHAHGHDPKLPIVAFGSHVATDILQAAQDRGATVMPRGQFTAQLPQILRHFASGDE